MGTAFTPEPQKLVGRGQCRWLGLAGDLWVAMDPTSMQTLPRPHLFSQVGGVLLGVWLCCSVIQD